MHFRFAPFEPLAAQLDSVLRRKRRGSRAMAAYWTDIYQQHFQSYFHKPFDIQVFSSADNLALKLARYDLVGQRLHFSGRPEHQRVERRGLPKPNVFASIGLADKLIRKGDEDFGEVILMVDAPEKEVPLLFVNALFFILHHDIPLSSRFAIGGIAQMQPAFAKRHGKVALYFTLAGDDSEDDNAFNKVRRGEEFGRVYQAYFVTAEEEKYLAECGPDAFEKHFSSLGEERHSLDRASCV